ncbi:hypothetical protein AAG906_035578 [Vitis piasezkii]
MLLTNKVLQFSILPKAALDADYYLSSLTTIIHVEVSTDLQVEYIRSELGRHMKLRLTQEICFIEEESLKRGSWVIAILDRMKNEKKKMAENDDWEGDGDDPNENIIHIK